MMKDWASARQRVQDLKAVDPRGSEKLNKEITGVSKHCQHSMASSSFQIFPLNCFLFPLKSINPELLSL